MSALPVLFVAETGGGFFGRKSRRILCIGAPYLATFSVGELRSVIAHELGHYAGGDTRIAGILAFTEGAFRSVLQSTEENPLHEGTVHWTIDMASKLSSFVGESLVKIFMRIYLVLTRPLGRKEELAADVLSAELAGRDVAIRALEAAHVTGPLYRLYLDQEVANVLDAGAIPTDLLDGYRRFRERLELHGKVEELTRLVQEEKTDSFDTHPAPDPEMNDVLPRMMPPQTHELVRRLAVSIVLGLFEGALLERGAVPLESLGERSRMFRLGEETVRPGAICADAMTNDVARRELSRWAMLLSAPAARPDQSAGTFEARTSSRASATVSVA